MEKKLNIKEQLVKELNNTEDFIHDRHSELAQLKKTSDPELGDHVEMRQTLQPERGISALGEKKRHTTTVSHIVKKQKRDKTPLREVPGQKIKRD